MLQESKADSLAISGFAWFVMFALPLLYFFVEHSWDASSYYEQLGAELAIYDGSVNSTAERESSLNLDSSMARVLLAGIGFLAFFLASQRQFNPRCMLIWLLAAYFCWLCSSVLWSINPPHTAYKLAVLLVFILAAVGLSRKLSLRELSIVFAGSCLFYLICGLVAELSEGTFQPFRDYRFTGTCHPNTIAAYAAILCLASASLFVTSRRKVLAVLLFGFAASMLVLTKSRTTAAAVIVGMVVLQTICTRREQRLLLISSVIGAIAVGGFTLSTIGRAIRERLGHAAALGRVDEIKSLTGRLPLWEELLDDISSRPLLGHGYMAYWDSERVEYLSELLNWEIPHGHNMYLDVLIDGGIVALVLFIAVCIAALATAVQRHSANLTTEHAFVVALVCYALFHGLGESFFKLPGSPNFMLLTLLLSFAWRQPADVPTVTSRANRRVTPVLDVAPS